MVACLRCAGPDRQSLPTQTVSLDGGLKGLIWLPKDGLRPNQRWVIFAPTWITANEGNVGGTPTLNGYEAMIRRLTEEGIALVGVDVGITFGNRYGRDGFTALYRHLTEKMNFNPKGSMLVQSQGGMMGYTWILENPGIIECVGGIFPITSVRDYFGIPYFAQMWGLTEQFLTDNIAALNPLDRAAEFNFPILHLHGDRDEAARIEYAREFFSKVPNGQLVELASVGHEYRKSELFENEILFDFMIANTPR